MSVKINIFKLRRIIAERGLKQSELAEAAGLALSTVSMVANGKPCRIETALAIANALDVDLDDLIFMSEQ